MRARSPSVGAYASIDKRTAARVAGLVKKHGSAAAALISAEAMLLPATGFALLAQQMAEDIVRHEAYTQQRLAAVEEQLTQLWAALALLTK